MLSARIRKYLSVALGLGLLVGVLGTMPVAKKVAALSEPPKTVQEIQPDDDYIEVFRDQDDQYWAQDISIGYKIMPKECVTRIVAAAKAFASEVDISEYNLPIETDEQRKIYWADLNLCKKSEPMLFYLQETSTATNGKVATKLIFKYSCSQSEAQTRTRQIETVISEALSHVRSDMSDYQKALVLHDWLADNVEYAYSRYLRGELKDDDYTCYGALVKKEAVCEGYTKSYTLLMRQCGIESFYVYNDKMNHAWNVIRIGSEYFNVDVTWDDPVQDQIGQVSHKYLLVDNNTLYQRSSEGNRHLSPDNFDASKLVYTRYADGKWVEATSPVSNYNGRWYYCKFFSEELTTKILSTGDILNEAGDVIFDYGPDYGSWPAEEEGSHWGGTYSRPHLYSHYLIFNTNRTVMFMDLDSEAKTTLTMYNETNIPGVDHEAVMDIYGFKVQGDYLIYSVASRPSTKTERRILTNLLKTGDFHPTPTEIPTPSPTPEPIDPTPTPTLPPMPTPITNPDDPTFEDFVERLYTIALNRSSEPEGKEFWVKRVVDEGATGADCARFFLLDAPEFMDRGLSNESFVDTLYRTFFNREAEPDGKAFHLQALNHGAPRATVIGYFIESTEWCDVCASYGVKSGSLYYKATKASSNATNFAMRLYSCCLFRDPEPDGLKYWSLALTNLEKTGADAAAEFFESEEFKGFDTSDFSYVVRLYRTFMGRDPEDGATDYWIGQMQNGKSRHAIMAWFAQSPEFTDICKKYGIERGTVK